MDDLAMIKFFEELTLPEGVRAELLRREIVLSPGSDLVHNDNVMRTADQIPRK